MSNHNNGRHVRYAVLEYRVLALVLLDRRCEGVCLVAHAEVQRDCLCSANRAARISGALVDATRLRADKMGRI